MAFETVAKVADIPPGTGKMVVASGRKAALFNVNGTFYAVEDACSHRAASLSQGKLRGKEVVCPWHGSRFDLATGKNLSPPATRNAVTYKVQVVGEDVQIDVFG
jgi:3-phenylpropionate/trans-cinnamate dioxygenase ferredoxin component